MTSASQVKGHRDAVWLWCNGQVTRETHIRCLRFEGYIDVLCLFSGLWFFSVPALILNVCCSSFSVWTGLKNLCRFFVPVLYSSVFVSYATGFRAINGFQHQCHVSSDVQICGSLFQPQSHTIKKIATFYLTNLAFFRWFWVYISLFQSILSLYLTNLAFFLQLWEKCWDINSQLPGKSLNLFYSVSKKKQVLTKMSDLQYVNLHLFIHLNNQSDSLFVCNLCFITRWMLGLVSLQVSFYLIIFLFQS